MAVSRIARLKIREGANKEFESVFTQLTNEVHENEPAAIHHILHKSRKDPNAYIIYEQYEDEEAMLAHGRTRHFNTLGIKIAAFVVEPTETEVMDNV